VSPLRREMERWCGRKVKFGISLVEIVRTRLRGTAVAAILVWVLVSGAHAQGAPGAQTKCRIAGTVVDAVTQQPVRDSEVMLRGPMASASANWKSLSTTADSDGRFSFDDLAPGRYMVTAFHRGYVNMGPGQGGTRPRMAAVVAPGQNLDDFIVALTPGGTISGHITNAASKPLADVTLQVLKRGYQSGHLELVEVASAQTNKSGEFRVASLAPGKYFLRAMFLDPPPLKPGADEAYVPTYYPGATDQSQAVPLVLRPGEELGSMDMALTLRRAFTVKGRVLDALTKSPVAESEVSLVDKEGGIVPSPYHAMADAKGNFELRGMPAGDYVAMAEKVSESGTPVRRSGQKSMRIAGTSEDGLDIPIALGVEVSGRIHVEGKADVELSQMTGSLEATENWASESAGEIESAHVRFDGSFVFYDVPEGSYRINFFPVPQGYYVTSGSGGTAEESPFSVARGIAVRALDFVLRPGAARIEGTALLDQQPAPGVALALVPSGERRGQPRYYRTVIADRLGKFAMQGLVPGDYKVFAFEELERGALMDPDFLAEYESSGKDVSVKEGDVLNLQVDVIPRD